MKAMLISFVVGVAYALLRVKSPAPPLVALAGLLGMVWGEQVVSSFLAKKPPSSADVADGGWRPQGTVHPAPKEKH